MNFLDQPLAGCNIVYICSDISCWEKSHTKEEIRQAEDEQIGRRQIFRYTKFNAFVQLSFMKG